MLSMTDTLYFLEVRNQGKESLLDCEITLTKSFYNPRKRVYNIMFSGYRSGWQKVSIDAQSNTIGENQVKTYRIKICTFS